MLSEIETTPEINRTEYQEPIQQQPFQVEEVYLLNSTTVRIKLVPEKTKIILEAFQNFVGAIPGPLLVQPDDEEVEKSKYKQWINSPAIKSQIIDAVGTCSYHFQEVDPDNLSDSLLLSSPNDQGKTSEEVEKDQESEEIELNSVEERENEDEQEVHQRGTRQVKIENFDYVGGQNFTSDKDFSSSYSPSSYGSPSNYSTFPSDKEYSSYPTPSYYSTSPDCGTKFYKDEKMDLETVLQLLEVNDDADLDKEALLSVFIATNPQDLEILNEKLEYTISSKSIMFNVELSKRETSEIEDQKTTTTDEFSEIFFDYEFDDDDSDYDDEEEEEDENNLLKTDFFYLECLEEH